MGQFKRKVSTTGIWSVFLSYSEHSGPPTSPPDTRDALIHKTPDHHGTALSLQTLDTCVMETMQASKSQRCAWPSVYSARGSPGSRRDQACGGPDRY